MMVRPTWNQYFMGMAVAASGRGTCPRAQVGSILVFKGRYPVSSGFNGSLPGDPHCIDVGCEMDGGHCVRAIHSECNAIHIAQEELHLDTRGMTLYCTHAPCVACAHRILDAGIVQLFYLNGYVPALGLDFISKHIEVKRVTL